MENALDLTMKAFMLRKAKFETLAYAFVQVLPVLKDYWKQKHTLAFELNFKTRHVLVLEPICNGEREAWLEMWLNGEVSTRQLKERMRQRFQWVEYYSFSDFLEGVKVWREREN